MKKLHKRINMNCGPLRMSAVHHANCSCLCREVTMAALTNAFLSLT